MSATEERLAALEEELLQLRHEGRRRAHDATANPAAARSQKFCL